MRSWRAIPLALILVAIVALAVLLFLRAREPAAAFGPAVAYCPGPDLFGYTCASADAVAYIDATDDTFLYADDGFLAVDLPFPFDFYGTIYEEVTVVTNGFLTFGADPLPLFSNACLEEGPLPELGEALIPFWDDLDLRFAGFIETATVGEAPNRTFVIEWDGVPRFAGDPEDTVTFEVQFFEATNNVVFLYQDVSFFEEPAGGSATVGQQSAIAGVTLQFSCNQPNLSDRSGLQIVYPEDPNDDLAASVPPVAASLAALKPGVDIVAEELALHGADIVPTLRSRWLNTRRQQDGTYLWANLAGDAQAELIYLWRGPAAFPERHTLAVLAPDAAGSYAALLQMGLGDRENPLGSPVLIDAADLTGDGLDEVVLRDRDTGRLLILTTHNGPLEIQAPGSCRGDLDLKLAPEAGLRCGAPDSAVFRWWQNRFVSR